MFDHDFVHIFSLYCTFLVSIEIVSISISHNLSEWFQNNVS